MKTINIIIKDLDKKYQDIVKSITVDNFSINVYVPGEINSPDIILFGTSKIEDGHIINDDNIKYIYIPIIYTEDFINYDWIFDCWPQTSSEVFKKRMKNLLINIANNKINELNNIFLDTLINLSPNMIWVKDLEGRHLLVNHIFEKFANKPISDIIGKVHKDIWGLTEEQKIMGKCICTDSDAIVCALGRKKTFDEKLTLPNNIIKDLFTYKVPIRNKYDKIIGTAGIAYDVTSKNIQKKKFEHAVSHDFLTDIYNRAYFVNEIGKRMSCGEIFTIYFFDLDNFKQLNDTYGHQLGDRALSLFAIILTEVFTNGIVARYAGDEFIVAVPVALNMEIIEDNIKLLDIKLLQVIKEDSRLDILSTSIGIYSNDVKDNIDKTINFADIAMYRAKNIHKNERLFEQYNKQKFKKVFYQINEKYKGTLT